MDEPRPERVQHGLGEKQQRRLERADVTEPVVEKDVGQSDLEHAERDDDGDVGRASPMPTGSANGRQNRNANALPRTTAVAAPPAGSAGLPHEPEAGHGEGPAQTRQRREDVPLNGSGAVTLPASRPTKNSASPAPSATMKRQLTPPDGLLQEPRPEEHEVDRRGRLQEDRARGRRQFVREDEQDHRRRVDHADARRKAGRHRARAAGSIRRTATAATPERNDATCQPVSCVALIAAPPVENSMAAARIARRERNG